MAKQSLQKKRSANNHFFTFSNGRLTTDAAIFICYALLFVMPIALQKTTIIVPLQTYNKLLSKMLHCKIAVAYSRWEFPLAGGLCVPIAIGSEGGKGDV
jgi:hypothetical protein